MTYIHPLFHPIVQMTPESYTQDIHCQFSAISPSWTHTLGCKTSIEHQCFPETEASGAPNNGWSVDACEAVYRQPFGEWKKMIEEGFQYSNRNRCKAKLLTAWLLTLLFHFLSHFHLPRHFLLTAFLKNVDLYGQGTTSCIKRIPCFSIAVGSIISVFSLVSHFNLFIYADGSANLQRSNHAIV